LNVGGENHRKGVGKRANQLIFCIPHKTENKKEESEVTRSVLIKISAAKHHKDAFKKRQKPQQGDLCKQAGSRACVGNTVKGDSLVGDPKKDSLGKENPKFAILTHRLGQERKFPLAEATTSLWGNITQTSPMGIVN